MNTLVSRRTILTSATVALALTAAVTAHATLSPKVQRTFRGRILVTLEPLPEDAGNDAKTIKVYTGLHQKQLKSQSVEEAATWTFYYTAFMTGDPPSDELSLDFHTTDKAKAYVANKRLHVESGAKTLTGFLTIDENEGPNPGTTYDVILRGQKGDQWVDLAKTRLTLQ
jgi:hypothetical protein